MQSITKSKPPCRYFKTPTGCRAGSECPFGHSSQTSRPIPNSQLQDPRSFQIKQLKRRYSPSENHVKNGFTELAFKLVPSDPDFPFELSALEITLLVPSDYPNSKPKLRINNSELSRGYQLNVENGYQDIISKSPNLTLLQSFNSLDRNLETLLAAPKAETVKIILHSSTNTNIDTNKNTQETLNDSFRPSLYTSEQIDAAKTRRDQEIRQLETRLGRLPLFTKSDNGNVFDIPIEPRRRQDLPSDIQSIKTIKLIIPDLYPLENCQIQLTPFQGKSRANIESNFGIFAEKNSQMNIFALINRLSQNVHNMAVETPEVHVVVPTPDPVSDSTSVPTPISVPDSKSCLLIIPRPPEWHAHTGSRSGSEIENNDSSQESSDDSLDYNEKEANENEADGSSRQISTGPERGILMSFPNLELYGIELLELISLSLIIKCGRCKDFNDVLNIRNAESSASVKNIICKKCSNQISIGFRMDLMHANCVRAGYLDLEGCTVVDMLPSNFLPTCSECSRPHPAPGVISVRGESTLVICRECHKRLSFKIPEIKFLQVSTNTIRATQAPPRRKKKELLGIKVGENLPSRGRCKHYSKSYRWFRFSCCSKVYACDKCHDQESDHPNEHANRMICGYCSREQNFRPEDCGVCHVSLIARAGSGFWEGGKGTRDKVRMSRKDPRKYKRRGATVPGGGTD